MIGIIGVATIRSLDVNIEKKLNIKNDTSIIKVIKSTTRLNQAKLPLTECEVKFFIQMRANPDCKSLDDYTGQVFPFLKNLLGPDVACVKIINTENLGPPTIKHITEI